MAESTASTSETETVVQEPETNPTHAVTLKLRKPKSDKKVKWTTGTVDNEHMNKKKSKCCCIYEKPRMFGESSSEDEDDCTGHCHGHKKKCFRSDGGHDHDSTEGGGNNEPGPSLAS